MDGGIAAIIAASLGAIGAAIGLIITKENKTSEFRQAWIDGLRKELAELMMYYCCISDKTDPEIVSELTDKINFAAASIKLRFTSDNPTPSEDELLQLISKNILATKPELSPQVFRKRYYRHSEIILKSEWERVKKGERKYRICVMVAVILASISIVIPSIYVLCHIKELFELLIN
ncbi:hypothetical protein [Limnobaculum xujianqingii]|uniref:hypothetical protein n=1 Tax=Limnobaculum xujianqingii TaxID=2738837 RepID=UPI00112DE9C3|nr:hypothetical protein [Limnobaculum xujianqingii]